MKCCVGLALSCVIGMGLMAGAVATAAEHVNLASAKPYTLTPAPNYAGCTDPNKTDLTDGRIRTSGQLWTQPGCVGWTMGGKPVIITIDLGQVEPIQGVSYHTAAGNAGVDWPSVIDLQFSDDGKTYHDVGDLVRLDQSAPAPPYGDYHFHTFQTDKLAAHGRYVRLVIVTEGSFVFTDEIQVFRGPDSLLQEPMKGQPIDASHATDALRLRITQQGVRRSLHSHATMVQSAVQSIAPPAAKLKLLTELRDLEQRINQEEYPQSLDGFRATVPMGNLDAKILAVYGKLLAAKGAQPMTLWHTPPYQLLELLQKPPMPATIPQLDMRMMRNEHRAQVFNLTNASDNSKQAYFDISGLPSNALKVFQVEYVHAEPGGRYRNQLKPRDVAAALVPLISEEGRYKTTIPAGMTRQGIVQK